MNQVTQQASAPEQSTAAPTGPSTFEQRLNALQDSVLSETSSQPAGDPAGQGDGTPPPAEAPARSPAGSGDVDKIRAERAARLDALKAEERARVDEKARRNAGDRAARELEQERQARLALEQQAKNYIDPSKLDAASFFELARTAKVDPVALGNWIKESIANPERAATEAATRALDPRLAALTQQLEAQAQVIQQMQAAQQQEREAAHVAAIKNKFVSFVGQSAERAPLAAKFLEKHGPGEFFKIAERAAATLPEQAGEDAVLDATEAFLDGEGRAYAHQFAELYGFAPPDPSKAKLTPPPKSAAAKAKTVSNANAQERASVVQEDAFAKLSYNERIEAVKRML